MSLLGVAMAERRPILVTLYLALARAASPFYRLAHFVRCRVGKDDPARGNEKFGRPRIARPAGPLVWIHAASVGETNSVLPVIEALALRGLTVLLTTVTRTSADLAAQRLPDGALHQYVPFDSPAYVSGFLSHWRPDLAMVVESEVWPGVFLEINRRGIPFILLNGRMSDRSFKGWSRIPTSARAIFGCLDLSLAQTPVDADRLRKLGCSDVVCPGNLKFDANPQDAAVSDIEQLRASIGTRPVWLAALTHPGEDEIVLDAHKTLMREMPDCMLFLVPRHPARADAIADLVEGKGLGVLRRSSGDAIDGNVQVFLGDTMGEMALFYTIAPVAFLGGSFADVGGHSPVEAMRFQSAIISGAKVVSARTVYKDLWDQGAAIRLDDECHLAENVRRLLSDPSQRLAQIEKAGVVAKGGRGALQRTLDLVEPKLRVALDRVVREPGP